MDVILERAYDKEHHHGVRILVDRIWPRGVKKEDLNLDEWLKEVAPSDQLRKWFGHDPARWEEFKTRYFKELDENNEAWEPLLKKAKDGELVLIFGAKDREHNNAVALREFLEKEG